MPTINGYQNGEPIEAVDINQFFLRGADNAIINGDMRVAQRGTSGLTVADGAYGLDRWVMLGSGVGGAGSSGQSIQMFQATETGGGKSMIFQGTIANLKFGCVQIIENRNIGGIRSGTVTVQFKCAAVGGAADVRCAVLGWSGTADFVTRDVVASTGTPWLSSPPVLAADWSYLNTPVDLNVTSQMATYSVNANVTGNPNNLAVFIWVNGTTHGTGGVLKITDVQIESGAIATPFQRKTFQEQLADCQRYYNRITAVGSTGNFASLVPLGFQVNTTNSTFPVIFAIPMRSSPTISGANIGVSDRIAFTIAVNTLSISNSGSTTATVTATHSANGAERRPIEILANNNITAFVDYTAEL